MNRYAHVQKKILGRVPHASGDEPEHELLLMDGYECSPREWG